MSKTRPTLTLRPLSDRTWLRPPAARVHSQFESKWSATKELLLREVDHLDGTGLALELDVRERDVRLDGELRANAAHPATPAAVVAFDTPDHGPMLYRADRYETRWVGKQGPGWQQNVRAIALTLEALRAADRYGATETGQQYQGFKAIGPGTGATASHMTRDDALAVLWSLGRTERDAGATNGQPGAEDRAALARYYREARRSTHPDLHDGDRSAWDQVEQAARTLGINR